jgi:hypothetical protein
LLRPSPHHLLQGGRWVKRKRPGQPAKQSSSSSVTWRSKTPQPCTLHTFHPPWASPSAAALCLAAPYLDHLATQAHQQ